VGACAPFCALSTRAMRYALSRTVSLFFTVVTLSISLFPSLLTQVPLTAYVCVGAWVRARPFARYPRALWAMRYAGQPVSSLLIITVLTTSRCQFHFCQVYLHRLPCEPCGSIEACPGGRRTCLSPASAAARSRRVPALAARSKCNIIICQAGQPVSSLLIITDLTTSRCQFHFSQVYTHRLPLLLMCVCVKSSQVKSILFRYPLCVCVRACARVCALCAINK
jgi:hypothetical protein